MTRGVAQPSRWRLSRWRIAAAGAAAGVMVAGCGAQSGGIRAKRAAAITSPARGFSPQTLRSAYGVSPLLRKGVDGRGETVVLPEFGASGPGTSSIRQDLTAFDKRDHLPRVDLTLSRALGYSGQTSSASPEEILDAEMVHAMAPGAKITILLLRPRAITPPYLASLLRASAGRGNIVALTFSECEHCFSRGQLRSVNHALDEARERHVSVLAASGDQGPLGSTYWGAPAHTRGVGLPAASPLVTAVGGTHLLVRHDAYGGESAWDLDHGHHTPSGYRITSGGGGVSARYARPGYQDGLPVIGEHRGVPDVAAVADPGLATVLVQHGHEVTVAGGGTSAATPLWAAIAALADQDAHRQLGFLNQGLYRIAHSTLYHRAFHDITHGSNTVTLPTGKQINGYHARPGWDPVTGWGTPNAQELVPLLAREVHPDPDNTGAG